MITPLTTDLTVAPDHPITTTDDAIAEAVRLSALRDVIDRRTADLKAWLTATDPDVVSALESGDGHKRETLHGSVVVTSPSLKATVTDRAAFDAWVIRNLPDRVTVVETIRWDVLEDRMADDPGLRRRIMDVLDDVDGVVHTETVMDAKVMGDLTKPKHTHVTPDGRIIHRETGEVIPGAEARPASTPRLDLKPDKTAAGRLADHLYAMMAPMDTPEVEG